MKKSRRKSRELALQALYQWLLTQESVALIKRHMQDQEGFERADGQHFAALVDGATGHRGDLEAAFAAFLDRPVEELSPIEHAILLLAAEEMTHHLDIPYRVIINEAIELAKGFGGSEGHRYVNGVLDKLAGKIRHTEVSHYRGAGRP